MPAAIWPGISVTSGPGGGIPANPGGAAIGIAGGAAIGTEPGVAIGCIAGPTGCAFASDVPQLRQNRIPGAFSPRHDGQITGNPPAGAGVLFGAPPAAASEVPQFKQNAAPGGLSWPQFAQRIPAECRSNPRRSPFSRPTLC
jgi:hypothetical protein